MDSKEILNFCLERGLLIDKEILSLFSGTTDVESAKLIIEKIKSRTNSRIINRRIFYENQDKIEEFFSVIPEGKRENIQKLKIELGLSIEISKQELKPIILQLKEDEKIEIFPNQLNSNDEMKRTIPLSENSSVKIVSTYPSISKKFEFNDFVTHFRNRFSEIRGFIQERPELTNVVSINKINGSKQTISVIGMVADKKTTKNKNIMLDVEDLTGRIKVVINQNKKELYEKAENLCLDSIIGLKGTGSREIFFANDIFFPEAMIPERKSSPVEEYALFISDIHIGSKLFFENNFLKFIDYLNGKIPNTPEVENIKYLFAVGDIVAGVGVYPGQERDLEIKDIEGQYIKAAELFSKIRSNIQIIMLPGNHDCVRLAEPQPVLDEKYAWPLYNLKNIIMVSNPSMINIGAKNNFSGFDVLSYHGFSYPFYVNNVPKLMAADAINAPDKIMHYLLQHRHLAPSHSSVQYTPHEKDPLTIRNVPDIFVSGHTHKGAVSYYNNILVISSTCWESLTPFQEKMGNKPDFCKVPMFNLKTRAVRILDFYEKENES